MATHKPAKIQDVARRAGVSISTISNALNGRTARMSADTLARIETTIAELDFRPNQAARQLKTGHNPILGLLVPSIANPAFGMLAREVDIAAQEHYGYRVMLGNTQRSQDKETSFFDDLLAHGVRGVIVCSSLVDQHHLDAAVARGLVVVSYDRHATPDQAPVVDHVSMDNVRAGVLATRHLIEHGHRRLAFATPSGRTVSRSDKLAGFLAAAQAAGLRKSARTLEGKSRVAFGDSEMADVGRALAAAIAADPDRPTGVVAVNDMLAIGLLAGLRDCGLRVPKDISVVGIDDLFLSSLFRPALTSIRSPLADIARKMVERVIARLKDPRVPPEEFLFEPLLMVRETVSRFAPAPRSA